MTRQLRYSRDERQLALDLCLFINGLPIATFELKNSLTKQTVEQYSRDRDPKELLFQFGRCIVHFVLDDQEVRFNLGWKDGASNPPNPDGLKQEVFDSIIVVTDRLILDQQIRDTIKQFAQVGSTVAHAEGSGDLRKFIEGGKKIIITTVQKFPFILDDIGTEHRGRHFAIIIDEAHSSQGGRTTAAMSTALSAAGAAADPAEAEEETVDDIINRIMEARKMLPNASYFAFTATPKNKTLAPFETAYEEGGQIKHRPFHSYSMKRAIQEGFILDVLQNYTPVSSYYKLIKKVEADPEFDTKKANKRLRRYVESHDYAIRLKAEIMVDHFHEQVISLGKIEGQAR